MPTMLLFSYKPELFISADDAAYLLYEHFNVAVETKEDLTLCIWLEEYNAIQQDQLPILEQLGLKLIEQETISDQNWFKNCPELFQILRIGELEIVPIESSDSTAGIAGDLLHQIKIIPGTGFGTGHHATTALLIKLLQDLKYRNFLPTKILDLGTGSGLLALVLERLHNCPIDAIDIDELAIANARDNLAINHSQNISLKIGGIELADSQYNLVVANLYAELLIEFEDKIRQLIPTSGMLFLSGIMNEKAALVKNHYSELNWHLDQETSKDNWTALVFTRK